MELFRIGKEAISEEKARFNGQVGQFMENANSHRGYVQYNDQ